MKTVSVIIPVYNVCQYLEQCISSVVAQTYREMEIILIDDGSTDESSAICDMWKTKDDRIKVIHKENGGLSDARNAGLNIAAGDYICFVDSDDYIADDLVENAVQAFDRGADLVSYQYTKLYEDGYDEKSHFLPGCIDMHSDSERMEFYVKKLLQYKLGWEVWGRVFRRDIIEKYQIRFADDRKVYAEDLHYSLCYCAFVNKIIVLPNCSYFYRIRKNSIMSKQGFRMNCESLDKLGKELLFFFERHVECKTLCQDYSIIYYMIMNHEIEKYYKRTHASYKEVRLLLMENLSDFSYFRTHFLSIANRRKMLYLAYSTRYAEDLINLARYYALGHEWNFLIRRKIIAAISKLKEIVNKVR